MRYISAFWERWKGDRVIQILLAAFTFGIVIVGYLQWRTLAKTDATLKAAQRPWIEFDVPQTEALGWIGTEFGALAHFGLKNSGHSPALNVRGVSKTLLVWANLDVHKIQDELCAEFNQAKEDGYGETVFPNNPPLEHSMLFEILPPEIARFKATAPKFPRPLVIGCFSYFFYADHSVHNTGFMYMIRPRPPQLPFALPKEGETIPPDKFDLIPYGSSQIN